eukprot:s172_g6.t1
MGGALFGVCALCGICRCRNCRMRDCGCCKRCLRSTGVDKFDDFELVVVVHDAQFTGAAKSKNVCIRITAGIQSVSTSENTKAVFHETLSILVEQGTESVAVELWDVRERRALATLKLDPMKDSLSMSLDADDTEKGVLQDVDMSRETDMLLRSQIQKAQAHEARTRGSSSAEAGQEGAAPAKELSKVEMFAKGCAGAVSQSGSRNWNLPRLPASKRPLDHFGSWGSRSKVWVAVRGPPEQKRYTLCIFFDDDKRTGENKCNKGEEPQVEVELLKVLSVQADPARDEVFIINYVEKNEKNKVKQRLTFSRLDRARDVWVEMMTLLITRLGEIIGGCSATTTRMILKREMERFGNVDVCHMGNRDNIEKEPPWVRFSDPKAAEAALEAISTGQVVIDGVIIKAAKSARRGPPLVSRQPRDMEMGSRDLFLQRQGQSDGGAVAVVGVIVIAAHVGPGLVGVEAIRSDGGAGVGADCQDGTHLLTARFEDCNCRSELGLLIDTFMSRLSTPPALSQPLSASPSHTDSASTAAETPPEDQDRR